MLQKLQEVDGLTVAEPQEAVRLTVAELEIAYRLFLQEQSPIQIEHYDEVGVRRCRCHLAFCTPYPIDCTLGDAPCCQVMRTKAQGCGEAGSVASLAASWPQAGIPT